MRGSPAPHHDLLADALRGPSPQEAAGSLAFWRGRLERLPLRRLAARREARAMVAAWEDRVRRAELERNGGGAVGRLLAGAAVLRGQRPAALARRAILAVVPRRVVVTAATLILAAVLTFGVLLGVGIASLL